MGQALRVHPCFLMHTRGLHVQLPMSGRQRGKGSEGKACGCCSQHRLRKRQRGPGDLLQTLHPDTGVKGRRIGRPGLALGCPGREPQRLGQVHTRPWPSACRGSRSCMAGLSTVPRGAELEDQPGRQAHRKGQTHVRDKKLSRLLPSQNPLRPTHPRGNPGSRETRGSLAAVLLLAQAAISPACLPRAPRACTYSFTHLQLQGRPEGRPLYGTLSLPREPAALRTWRRPGGWNTCQRPASLGAAR